MPWSILDASPLGVTAYAPIDASYLVVGLNANLTNERRFVAGDALSAVDGGPDGDFTVNVDPVLRAIILTLQDFRKGTTAPTDVTIGTTPTVPALHFDATNELLTVQAAMPPDWDHGDLILELEVVLSAAETNGDTLDLTVDYVATIPQSTGEGPGKASTQLTPSLTVTTANGLAIGDQYAMQIVISAADATNPLADVGTIALEFHLTNITGVEEFNFIAGCIVYTSTQ